LNATYIECNRRIQALRAMGEDVKAYGRVLVPKILRAFPDDICRRWIIQVKREGNSEGDVVKLMEFLDEEVHGALTAQKIRGETSLGSNLTPTAATLHVRSKSGSTSRRSRRSVEPFCVFCENNSHWAQDCKAVIVLKERIEKLKAANRCFLCLNRGHHAPACSKRGKVFCSKCKKGHHQSVCMDKETTTSRTGQITSASVGRVDTSAPDFIYLQTARVWITGPTGRSRLTRCVLDGGSQCSFVARSIIDDLQLEVIDQRDLSVTAFESYPTAPGCRRLVRFSMRGAGTRVSTSLTAFESTHAFSHHPVVPYDIKTLAHARKLQLADPPSDPENLPIEILIGGDHYWEIVKDTSPIRLSPSVVLLPSKLGWILSGNRSAVTASSIMVNYVNLDQLSCPSDDAVRRFWDLETLGITDKQRKSMNPRDRALLRDFHASYSLEDQRRVVSLPRKENITLPSNHHNAERLFRRLEQRLESNVALRHVYHDHMLDYIRKEQVEIATSGEETADEFYLPHHAVKKEKRGEVKWRIVFDGSSHEDHAPSLNDALEMGPNLLPEILATLLRFRLYPVGIIGDIGQAFLQLSLHRRDRDLTRFFWYRIIKDEDGNYDTTREIMTYRFTRLPFGLTCSPFLLSATIRELADMYKAEFPTAASLVDNSTFMDDFAAGAENDVRVTSLYYELVNLMNQLGLPMAKWANNSEHLKEVWRTEGVDFKEITQTLGIDWDTKSDTFLMDPHDVIGKYVEGPTTKRQVLQAIARFYDPLGLLAPVSVVGKLLFQDTWCRGLAWDELLPSDLGALWNTWVTTMPPLAQLRVPRWLGTVDRSCSQVHVFCDASERAYGAALYVRSCTADRNVVRLAYSKNRLAPVKKVTLPRLELLAALVGARLLHYFCQATCVDATEATLWSDSTVALGWIRQDPNRWKTFVCNRVTEIQSYTTPSQWRHCPGKDNPADLLSRGVTAKQLEIMDVWWCGPPWLAQPPRHWPPNTLPVGVPLPEGKGSDNQTLSVEVPRRLLDLTKYSSYWKLLRVTAWILRFRQIALRKEGSFVNLTALELEAARSYWIQAVQSESFAAESKALRENLALPEGSKIARFNPSWTTDSFA